MNHIVSPSSIRAIVVRDTWGSIDISLADVFQELYGGLQQMIDHMNESAKNPSVTGERALAAKQAWEARIEWRRYLAHLELSDGTEMDLAMNPRTDFSPSKKFPNVIFLDMGEGHSLVLREMRMYNPSALEDFFRDKRTSLTAYKAMLDGTFTGFEKEDWPDILNGEADYYFLPERVLIPALERLYEDGFPRVTPRIKLFDGTNGTIYGLRNFHNQMRQLPYSAEAISQLSRYVGRLLALGLNDLYDNQAAHYVFDGGDLVTIDPDFIRMRGIVSDNAEEAKTSYRANELVLLGMKHTAEHVREGEQEDSLQLYTHQISKICSSIFDAYEQLTLFREQFKTYLQEEIAHLGKSQGLKR